MKLQKEIWKIILVVIALLGMFSACATPAAERKEIRGTLPSASASQQAETQSPTPEPAPTSTSVERAYILNTNTHKFHYPSCPSVDQMNESNKKPYTGTRDEIIDMGYDPCGRCFP